MNPLLDLAKKSLISNFRRLDFPMKISLLLTNKCNAKCIMCNIWKKKDHTQELTTKEIGKFFEKSSQISWMDLSGGEIFLRPDLPEIMDIIFSKCKNLFLLHYATNGFIENRCISITEKILSYKPKKLLITVSLDGDRSTHEKIRGISGVFDKTIKTFMGLRKFNSDNFKVFLGMTLFDENQNNFQAAFEAVKKVIPDISLDDFHLNIMQLSSHYYDNLDVKVSSKKEILKTIDLFRNGRDKTSILNPVGYLENRYQELAYMFLETGKCPLPCQALSNSCFIGPGGELFPCTMYSRSVGNIRDFDYDLGVAWNSDQFKLARKDIIEGRCPQCWTPCEAYQTIIGNFFKLRKFTPIP